LEFFVRFDFKTGIHLCPGGVGGIEVIGLTSKQKVGGSNPNKTQSLVI